MLLGCQHKQLKPTECWYLKNISTQPRWPALSPEFALNYLFHVGAFKTVLTTQIDQIGGKIQSNKIIQVCARVVLKILANLCQEFYDSLQYKGLFETKE